jgi:hypothetical protein
MDGCGGLLIALLVVLFLAGTINGFVVLIRLFARAVEAPAAPESTKRCIECGGRRFRSDGHCADCGASQETKDAPGSNQAVWESAKRELRRLHHRGLLPRERLDELFRVLDVERDNELLRESVDAVEPAEPDAEFLRDIVLPADRPEPARPAAEEPLEITSFAEPVELETPPASRTLGASGTLSAGPPEQRDWGKLLQAFMEEKNIRWGELLSGMLIVGSAIGLVISLWSTLKDSIPYFPALLFMLATAAIHGAGLYTLRRWKLQSTSRGLLLISTLLIPLNFLAAIALSTAEAGTQQRPITDPLYLAAVCIGSLGYGLIAFSSGRVFRKQMWWAMWLAVMVPSLSQLVIARLAGPDLTTEFVNVLAILPTAGFLAAMVVQLQLASNGRHFPKRRANQTFQLLGIGLFSLLMAFGLLLSKTGNVTGTLAAISPVVSIVAVLLTCTGLIVHHRCESAALATTRTAGTAVTLTGASFMLASLSFAWPKPELLVAVGLVDMVALTAMAFSARLPALHLPAIAAAALTALTSLHWWQDNIHTGGDSHRMLIDALLMGRSSLLLLGVAGLCLLLSTQWKKRDLAEDSRYYLLGAAGLAGVGVLVAYYAGFVSGRDAEWTTPVFALAAVGFLLAGRIIRWPWFAVGGAAVLFTAFYHLVQFNPPVEQWLSDNDLLPVMPFVMSALLTASVTAVWAFVVWVRGEDVREESEAAEGRPTLMAAVIAPLCGIALFASGITLPRLLGVEADQLVEHSAYLFWVTGLWGLAAVTMRHRFAMIGAQAVSLPAVAFAAAAFTQTLGWWDHDFGDPRHWQIQVGTLAVWCLLWTLARRIAARHRAAAELLGTGELNLDHAVVAGLVVAVAGLCMASALPGLAAEFQQLPVVRDNPIARPTPADSLAMLELVGLAIAVAFAAAVATSKRLASPAILGGAAAAMCVLVIFPTLAAHAVAPGDPIHAAQFGASLWLVLGLVAAGVAATFWERVSTAAVCGLVLLGALVPLLLAAQFAETPTAATLLRWGLAAYAVVAFAACMQQRRIDAVLARIGCRGIEAGQDLRREAATSSVIVVTVFPLLAFTMLSAGLLFNDVSLPIAAADVWVGFRSLGWSNAAPLWVLAALCLALAWPMLPASARKLAASATWPARERKPAFAITASLFIQLGVSLLYVLPVWQSGTGLNGPAFAELIQWNAVGLSACTLLWMAPPVGQAFQPDRTVSKLQSENDRPVRLESLTHGAFGVQLALTTAVTAALSLWAAVAIIASPDELAPLVVQLGDWKSFAAFALTATAIVLSLRRVFADGRAGTESGPYSVGLAVSLLMVVPLLAAAAGRLEIADTWRTYHVLTAGWTIGLLALTALAWRSEGGGRRAENPSSFILHPSSVLSWAMAFAAIVVFLGLRAQWDDPQRPWWLVGTAAAAALCTAAFGLLRRSQPFAYLSTGFVLLATTAALSHPWIGLAAPPTGITYQTVVFWNLVALSAAGLVWLFVEVVRQRTSNESLDSRLEIIPLHHTAAGIGLLLAGLFAVMLLFLRAEANPEVFEQLLPMSSPLGWGVIAGVAVLLLASLWDRRATHAIPGLYVMGLVASLTALDAFDLSLRNVWLGIGGIAAAYTLATGMLWWQRGRLSQLGSRLSVPEELRTNTTTGSWLPVANVGLAALATMIHFWVVLTFEDDRLRLGAGLATALLVPAFACLAQAKRGAAFRFLTLSAAVVAAVQIVWSFSPAELTEAAWLERMIRLLEVASVATLLYALGSLKLVPKLQLGNEAGDWGSSLRNVSVTTGGLALATLLVVLGMETAIVLRRDVVQITDPQVIVVSVILVGLSAGLIVLAVLPGRDPLRLSERDRMLYVYAAEVVASLLFLHIYLTKPEFFTGVMKPYWEFIVLGIAFAGAGLGEWFQRRKLAVLAEPLQRTGAFLPLLPALAAWVTYPVVAYDRYSLVLFIAGLLYVMLAMWRQSFRYAVAAACVGNLALWSLYYHGGIMLDKQPQLWLIPPALSVLVAGQLNRRRLSEAQLTALRYICVTLIYVSSTGEMFISGAGRSPWHPMVLATLSIIGVMAGMLMRVRAFLYLGSSFLFLSIVSMVWHAAQAIDKVWPWWVFGLVMGVVLLVLFGVFEKKRNEVLRVFGRLKEWER